MSDKGGKKGKQPPIESLESLESPAEVQVSAAEEKKKKKKQKNNSYPSRTAKSLCPLCRCLTDTRKLREHQARKTCQIVQNALRYHGLREQAEDDDTPNGGVVIDIYLLATVTRALLHCAERLQSLDPRLAKFYHWDLIKKTAERGMVRTQLAAEQEEEEEEEEEEEQTKKKKSKKVMDDDSEDEKCETKKENLGKRVSREATPNNRKKQKISQQSHSSTQQYRQVLADLEPLVDSLYEDEDEDEDEEDEA